MRFVRLLWLPVAMFGVAGLLAFWGIGILVSSHPVAPRWSGWLLIGVAAIKASVWFVVGRLRLRYAG